MNKKLLPRKYRGLIFLGLFFFSLYLFAQDQGSTDAFAPSKATVETVAPTPTPEPTNGMIESEIKDEMDSSAEEILKHQEKIKKQMEKMQNPEAGLVKQSEKLDTDHMIKNLIQASNPNLTKEQLDKMKLSEAMAMAMAPLKKMSSEDMKSMVLEQARGLKYYNLLVQYPKFLSVVIELIRDDRAVPQMVKVIEDKDRLKKFAAVMLCSILLGFVVARVISTKDRNLVKIFSLFIFRVILMMSVRIGIIYYFFSDELGPAFNVVTKVFFS